MKWGNTEFCGLAAGFEVEIWVRPTLLPGVSRGHTGSTGGDVFQ